PGPGQRSPRIDGNSPLTGLPVQLGEGQARLAKGGACHGQSVARIRLAGGARRVPGVGHQLGGSPNDLLAGGEKISFEAARQVAAVLNSPASLATEPI